jgi:GTPase
MEVVQDTLAEIGSSNEKTLVVFNKIDQYNPEATSNDIFEDEAIYELEDFKKTWMGTKNAPATFISAYNKKNIAELRLILYNLCAEISPRR